MINVIGKVIEAKRKKIKVYPCHANRASELGHPCERYLVYNRTQWEKKQLYKVETQFIFDHGNLVEEEAIQELKDAGLDILEQQRAFEINSKGEKITGHLDLKISNGNGRAYPCEIKGLGHWDWQKLNTLEDFHKSTKSWIRKYPAQLMLYLYGTNSEQGLFYIKDKQAPHMPKEIWVTLDYGYVEELLQKALRINSHVDNKTLPDRMSYEHNTCKYCPFLHMCLPDQDHGEGIELNNDTDLLDMLNKRAELSENYKEYKKIDEDIKEKVNGHPQIICGNWHITGNMVQKKEYTVAASESWRKSIKRVC